jgi:hypothetical protein
VRPIRADSQGYSAQAARIASTTAAQVDGALAGSASNLPRAPSRIARYRQLRSAIRSPPRLGRSAALIVRGDGVEG